MSEHPPLRKKISLLFLCLMLWVLSSCTSHLKNAKLHYVRAQEFSRDYQEELAIGAYKKALDEARKGVKKNPSAQSFMLKGMAELYLNLWEDAGQSFLHAFAHGFEKGQEWAEWVSLCGVSSVMHQFGLARSAFQIYAQIVEKSRLRPVSIFASQKYTEMALQSALRAEGKQKERLLSGLLRDVEKLTNRDLSCGFFHYLQAQVLSHIGDYRRSFEESVMARELGLPTQEIFRDNDLQIVFCYRQMKQGLPPEDWEEFHLLYLRWTDKWNWTDPETPDWKKR